MTKGTQLPKVTEEMVAHQSLRPQSLHYIWTDTEQGEFLRVLEAAQKRIDWKP